MPFNSPYLPESGISYLRQAVVNKHLSGDGPFTSKCHDWFEQTLGIPRALLATSCTHALEMAALLLNLEPGDEVIVPAFTFVSTVNAFVLHGGTPVFADIRPDTLNLDEAHVAGLITPRTRAIVPVHYGGVACEMNALLELSARHDLAIIEDNAHGLFGKYAGRWLGTFGCLAAQSFHETKNISCGEGGALLINDTALAERAEILRAKGTNRNAFFRGQVDKYTWVDVGSSYPPSDALAALLYAQLEQADRIQKRRSKIWNRYAVELADWAAEQQVGLPSVPPHCEHPAHLFYLILPSLHDRQAFIDHARASGVCSVFHYQPLHLSPMGLRWGGRPGQCPVTEQVSDRLTRLPLYFELTDDEQTQVIRTVTSYRACQPAPRDALSRAA
ncbi:MAG: dTDP-4-amino-4,6-dideoxygalactose transaminase [Planctomycetia bacterium]|nr:dTDP-4-amino-4,6-dideoxygalactose transaminase [Planctomycetia bacterium]